MSLLSRRRFGSIILPLELIMEDLGAPFTSGITITTTGTSIIDWGDGSGAETFVSGIELTHNYSAGSYTAKIKGDLNLITSMVADNSYITGVLDLELLTLLGNIEIGVNSVENINFNDNLSNLSADLRDNALVSLDLKNVDVTYLNIRNNVNMNSLTGLNSTGCTYFDSNGTLSLLSMDLTNFVFNSPTFFNINNGGVTTITGLNGAIGSGNNGFLLIRCVAELSNCIFNNSVISDIGVYGGTFTGDINGSLASFTKRNSNHFVTFQNLTALTTSINQSNNGHTAAQTNEILVSLDNTGITNKTLTLTGSNAAPDGTSGGFDGLTAKSNLIAKGWTVITN